MAIKLQNHYYILKLNHLLANSYEYFLPANCFVCSLFPYYAVGIINIYLL